MRRALGLVAAFALMVYAAATGPGCIPGLKSPIGSPLDDQTVERWCGVAQEGSAIYGEFVGDLDALVFVPALPAVAPKEIAPPGSRYGDRGPSVLAWQEYLEEQGISPGPLDGMHGPQTERATEVWLTRSLRRAAPPADERSATPWAADYLRAKGVVEDHRPGILALCQRPDDDVTKEDLLREGFAPAAEAFGDVVEIHRDVTVAPGQRSADGYDHQAILDKLRIVEAEATTALHGN